MLEYQVRDAFLKLLRPGVDFKSTFVEYAEKAIKRRERSADDLDESDRKRMVSELALKKIEMKNLFLQLGIVMKECEMRSLIDSFDTNGDGVITLTEFLDFIGPTRNRRGGNSMVLNQKCCWITTDKTTGMSNAFSVSAPTKKFLRGESKINEEKYETDSKVDNDASSRSVGLINGKIVMRKLANGEQRLCIELPERQKREDILRKFGLLQKGKHSDDDYGEEFEEEHDDYGEDFEGDDHDRSRSPVKKKDDTPKCDYSKWSAQHRRDGLKYLMEITKDARKEEALKAMLANGVPPKAPKFWIETSGGLQVRGKKRIISRNLDDLDEDDPTGSHELQLYWAPQKDDLVSFFSIEFGGQVGVAKIADNQYKEIYRDPIDADPEKTFSFTHMVRNLQPGTSYYFRIRAFNGFGPGDFSYKTFTTKPVAPEFPRVLKLSSNSVSFRWTFSKGFFRRMEELKEIFVLADRDGCGQISREELAAFLDERASSSVELKTFIGKVANSLGIDLSQGYGTLFDMIEGDDDGGLSWEEFESFFLNSGWGNMKSVAHGSQSLRSSMVSGNLTQSVGNHNAVSVKPGDITYVVERCESEIDSIYKEILRTNSGQGTITRLDPGKSYRFRVYSINADGVHGPKSQDIVVHTLLETPPVPTAKVIECRKVVIAWKPRATGTNTRDRAVVDKMLGDWAGTHGENDGGVSIEAAFAKYDKDQTGDIDAAELAYVLEDLGIEVTEDRLSETFALLDKNKDGVISYEEFGLWWRRDEVSYTIKRSEEVEPLQRYTSREVTYGRSVSRSKGRLGAIPEEQSINGGTVASAKVLTSTKARQVGVPIVSYRGSKPRCEIAGLTPNRLYHFKVRYVGSRSNSILSHPLVLMTAPLPPSPPVLVMVTSSTVRIKWYGPQYGGYKFVVHMKQAIGSDSVTGAYGSTRKLTTAIVGVDTGEDGWVNVYNGVENIYTNTSLPSDTSFLVRVMCLNYQGNSSEPSEQLTFTTLKRTDTSHTLTPKNAATSFTIDCTGDICVGDTILITERLFARPHREEDEHAPSIKPALSTNRSIISQGKSKLNDIATLKTGRKSIITKGNSKTNPLNMSTTSIHSVGGVSITPSAGEYLGERTMAVYVSKDNYRSIRDELALMNVTNRNVKKISKFRKLFLEVVWQKNSTEACKQFELKPGEIIERTQDHLEQFVVYRCRWNEENKRRPFADDWDSLTACFIAADC